MMEWADGIGWNAVDGPNAGTAKVKKGLVESLAAACLLLAATQGVVVWTAYKN